MSRITLHPKYGLNPSVDICFWCGEATGVVLRGYNKGEEAPREMVYSYAPCDKCQAAWKTGITLIEADECRKLNRPEMTQGLAPTGRWMVVKEEAFHRLNFFNADAMAQVIKAKVAFLEPAVYEMIMPKEDGK